MIGRLFIFLFINLLVVVKRFLFFKIVVMCGICVIIIFIGILERFFLLILVFSKFLCDMIL